MTAKYTLMDVSRSNYTTVKEGVTNLENKLFTVSVYVRGLTGPVQVKFEQMVFQYNLLFQCLIYCQD